MRIFGNLLYVDLYNEKTELIELDRDEIYKFIGGRGLGLYLIYKERLYVKDIDPIDADNPLIILSGPLCGTKIPMATRATAVFMSPLTKRWNYSTVGGTLASKMRYAGVDILYVVGKANVPVYLYIEGDNVDLKNAKELWGLDTVETEHRLWMKHGRDTAVLTIGPAGENLVSYALINHDEWRQFGREGGGAVMGSKNLKAIVFKPIKDDVPIEDMKGYNTLLKELIKVSVGPLTKSYRSAGTLGLIDVANEMGFFPSYYWNKVVLDKWEKISWGAVLKKEYFIKPGACLYCPVACHRVMKSNDDKVYDLEYESTMALGGLTGVSNPGEVISLCELADRMGLDTISLGNSIAFVIYLSERGFLEEKIKWGDYNKIKELIIKTAYRSGLGSLISLGVKDMAKELDVEDLAVHVKGLEPAGYDPRTLKGMILNYAVSERGADHLWASAYAIDIPGKGGGRFNTDIEKVKAVMDLEERNAIYDSIIVCKFGRSIYGWDMLTNVLNKVTGFDYSVDDIKRVARRIIVLHRYINKTDIRDDVLPKRWMKEPIELEGTKYVVNIDEWRSMVEKYYELRGYDKEGRVSDELLESFLT